MDNQKKSLVKNTVIIFLGKFCTQFISFFLVPLYTRCLNTEEFGCVDLITTYMTLLVPVILLQIENAVFRFLLEERAREEKKKEIISNVCVFAFASFLLFCLGMSLVAYFVEIRYFSYIIASAFALMLSSVLLQIVRGMGNTIQYAVGSIISGVSNVILNIITIILFGMGAKGILFSLAISNLLGSIYLACSVKLLKYVDFRLLNMSVLKEMLSYSTPLIPNGISWWTINASDRTLISLFIGVAANGIYAVANKFSNLFNGLFNILSITWTESVCVNINSADSERYFDEMVSLIFKLFSFVCLAIICAMPFAFNILIGPHYFEAYYHIPILMIAIFFNVMSSTFSAFFIALKKTEEMMWSTIASAIINVLINLLFIKKFGLYAASVSTLVAYFVMAVYRYARIRKYVNFRLSMRLILKTVVMAGISLYTYYCGSFGIRVLWTVLLVSDCTVSLLRSTA